MKPKIWVLTFDVNDYRQHGDYFISAWLHEPSYDEIHDVFKDNGPSAVKELFDKGYYSSGDFSYAIDAIESGGCV